MPKESIKTHVIGFISKLISIHNTKIAVKVNGSCSEQDKTIFIHENVVKWFIVYQLEIRSRDLSTGYTLGVSVFWAAKLTKNADTDKYKNSN